MGKLIYVFDDDEEVCEIMRISLEARGYEVATSTDGEIALNMVQERKPDLMVVDIKMPKINGYELISRVRMNPNLADIPIIVITGVTSESRRSNEEWKTKMGVQDFISKPFAPLDLINRIEQILGTKT
ncbi:MAG: response regulator [Candidatus Sumerlaeia bacterium]|nr:response regulator [Candidatus Sumerlaeia bacterium]